MRRKLVTPSSVLTQDRGREAVGVRLALAQMNVVVGDLAGNRDRIVAALGQARAAGADVVVFPELAISGYPPEDLLLRPGFLRASREALGEVAAAATDIVALVGTPWLDRDLANAVPYAHGARSSASTGSSSCRTMASSTSIATSPRAASCCSSVRRHLVGPTICEDVWQPGPPATDLALAGAQLLVNLSASPYHVGKAEEREEMLVTRARDNGSFFAFCNLVGGQDELVFDGHSVVLDDAGEVHRESTGLRGAPPRRRRRADVAISRRLRDVRRRELDRSRESIPSTEIVELDPLAPRGAARDGRDRAFAPELEQMRLALDARAAGLRGEERVHRGRSRRLGRDRLRRDGRSRRRGTRARARPLRLDAVAILLGGDADGCPASRREPRLRLPRDPHRERSGRSARCSGARRRARRSRRGEPPGAVRGHPDGALEHARLARALDREQVRARGRIRDALRRHGRRLRAPQGRLQDRRLPARAPSQRARRARAHPGTTIERPPSAELRADQRDEESIPPYELLDPVLEAYIELDRSREELLEEFDPTWSSGSLALVDHAEYKRRQAPPGVKLRPRRSAATVALRSRTAGGLVLFSGAKPA